MSINWFNAALFAVFSCFAAFDLSQDKIAGGVAWFAVAFLNLILIIIVHQHEIYDKLEDINKKITNTKINIDITEK